ncbi:MAG: hypothetical protein VX446_00990, partial [Bacteroidota bacterium]|nr:hypothetical protein [Bacteroidota bacterium]
MVVPFRLCLCDAQFFLGRRHAGLLERVLVHLDDPFPDRVVRVVVHPGLLQVVVLRSGLPFVGLFRRLPELGQLGLVVVEGMAFVLVVLLQVVLGFLEFGSFCVCTDPSTCRTFRSGSL